MTAATAVLIVFLMAVSWWCGWQLNSIVSEYQLKRALSVLTDDEKRAFYKAWTRAAKDMR